MSAILKNRYDVRSPPWVDRFGMPMQIHTPMKINLCRSKLKPEVEFQYCGRPFSKTKISNSVADRDLSSKFGMQTDFDIRVYVAGKTV